MYLRQIISYCNTPEISCELLCAVQLAVCTFTDGQSGQMIKMIQPT